MRKKLTGQLAGHLAGELAGRVTTKASELAGRAQEWRSDWQGKVGEAQGQVGEKADERLATLIEQRRSARGESLPPEVTRALSQRQQERQAQAEQRRFEADTLAQARTNEEKRVLLRVLGEQKLGQGSRYTSLLDQLAPSGEAAQEMAIHRALWSLAERRVVAVSVHGEVTLTRS